MMTEKEAWKFLSEEFEKKEGSRYVIFGHGLCYAVNRLIRNEMLPEKTGREMLNKINQYIPLGGSYIYPTSFEYKPHRAALARKFAEECGSARYDKEGC